MAKNKNTKYRGTADIPARIAATQGLRASGASGGHDSRPSRQRTRATAKRQAILNG